MENKEKLLTQEEFSAIEEVKAQWLATVDALVDPLIVIDESMKIKKVNKAYASFVGKDIKACLGRSCYELVGKKEVCQGCLVGECFKTGKATHFSLEGFSSSDSYHEVICQPVFKNSSVDGVVVLYQDKTQQKLIENKLRRDNKLNSIGMLAGGVAHEINNPLCGIIAFSQVLEKELQSELDSNKQDKKVASHLTDVKEILLAASRCKSIVEDLLLFSRQENPNQKKEASTKFDIISCLQNALRLSLLTSSKVKPEVVWQGEKECWIVAGYQKLLQVFVNIMQNAIQATSPGVSRIIIRVEKKEDGFINVDIEDNGCGIDPGIIDKIFDPFFTTKDVGMGTGLGLSICHGIITDMGGSITVSSKKDEGTCVSVRLPDFKE